MSLPVAIVGAGWMGRRHAEAVTACGDRVVAVVDPDPARAAALASAYRAQALADIDSLDAAGNEVAAAVVAGPSVSHLDTSVALLDRGIGVLVEKPHRVPGQDPAALLAHEARGARIGIGMSFRFDAAVAAAVTAVRDGRLGTLLEVHDRVNFQLEPETISGWYFAPRISGGGVLLTNGIHVLDRLRWIGGSDLRLTAAALTQVFPSHDCEDHASLHGSVGAVPFGVSLLWTPVAVSPSQLTLVGDRGIAVAEAGRGWRIDTHDQTVSQGEVRHEDDMLVAQWRAFRDGSPDCPSSSEVEAAMRDIEQVYATTGVTRLGSSTRPAT